MPNWPTAPLASRLHPGRALRQRRELEFSGWHLTTVEINGSFYSLERPESYAAWYRATPPGFVFALKGSGSSRARSAAPGSATASASTP